MTSRSYDQYCGAAHALELVGERWTLLLVRDLLFGPKRFTDLRQGLPRIPTNVLSSRLKELEAGGVLARRLLPRPSGAVVYELTEYGRELEPVIRSLTSWGLKSLGEPSPDDTVSPGTMAIGLQLAFRPEAARGLTATFEVRVKEAVVGLRIEDGELSVAEGPPGEPDLVIETDLMLRYLLTGEISAAQALDRGLVRLRGEEALFETFAETFSLAPAAERSPSPT